MSERTSLRVWDPSSCLATRSLGERELKWVISAQLSSTSTNSGYYSSGNRIERRKTGLCSQPVFLYAGKGPWRGHLGFAFNFTVKIKKPNLTNKHLLSRQKESQLWIALQKSKGIFKPIRFLIVCVALIALFCRFSFHVTSRACGGQTSDRKAFIACRSAFDSAERDERVPYAREMKCTFVPRHSRAIRIMKAAAQFSFYLKLSRIWTSIGRRATRRSLIGHSFGSQHRCVTFHIHAQGIHALYTAWWCVVLSAADFNDRKSSVSLTQ
jgi:hypothetical protein